MIKELHAIAQGDTAKILGVDVVNLETRQLTVEIHTYSVYSVEAAEALEELQRIETKHEWLEIACFKSKYYIQRKELLTHNTVVYPRKAGYFKFCQSYLFPYSSGMLAEFSRKSHILANSDITGHFYAI